MVTAATKRTTAYALAATTVALAIATYMHNDLFSRLFYGFHVVHIVTIVLLVMEESWTEKKGRESLY